MSQSQLQNVEPMAIRREEVQAGLIKEVIREGNGVSLEIQDQVTVHCTGMLDGPERKVFWSTRQAGQPFTFTLGIGEVISGWDSGCISMKEGEVATLFISSELGYGRDGYPSWQIPPGANLVYEVEVLSVKKK